MARTKRLSILPSFSDVMAMAMVKVGIMVTGGGVHTMSATVNKNSRRCRRSVNEALIS